MGQLTPIKLEDGTIIYIEATESTNSSPFSVVVPDKQEEVSEPKRGLFISDPQKQITQSFQAIKGTIRAYTTYTLNAFKNLAVAEVSEVSLEFGINLSGMTGVPYIATGTAGCNMKITVKCVFPPKAEQ